MATEAPQKETEAAVVNIDELLTDNCIAIGDTRVFGTQLISTKFLNIVGHALTSRDRGVKAIVFSDTVPEKRFGIFDVDSKTVVINLSEHWDASVELLKTDESYLSIRGTLWHNMLMTLFHELSHGEALLTDAEAFNAMTSEQLDDMGEEVARDELERLAIAHEIEPAAMKDEPFFGSRYMQLFVSSIKDGTETWAARQNSMHDEVYIYCDEDKDVLVQSFRDYIRGSYDPSHSNKAWDNMPTALPVLTAPAPVGDSVGTVSEGTVDPLAAVKADPKLALKLPIETDDAATNEALSENIVEPIDDPFVTSGWEDVAMAHLAGDGAPFSVPLPTPVVEQPVADTPVTSNMCTNCNAELAENVKFCGQCGTAKGVTAVKDDSPPWNVEPVAPAPPVQHIPTFAPTPQVQPYSNLVAQPHLGPPPVAPAVHTPYLPSAAQTPVTSNLTVQPSGGRTNEVLRQGLPHTGLTDQQIAEIMMIVWGRMYEVIFTKCGWQLPLSQEVAMNPLANKDGFHPDLRLAIMSGINVSDIAGTQGLIIAAQGVDHNTMRMRKQDVIGGIIPGFVSKNNNLPMFSYYINHNGFEKKRIFVPQNPYKPNKQKTDYTAYAKRAQAGERIAYIIDGDDTATHTYIGRIINGVFSN